MTWAASWRSVNEGTEGLITRTFPNYGDATDWITDEVKQRLLSVNEAWVTATVELDFEAMDRYESEATELKNVLAYFAQTEPVAIEKAMVANAMEFTVLESKPFVLFRMRVERRSPHIRADIFSGSSPDDLQLCGSLMMTHHQWDTFAQILEEGVGEGVDSGVEIFERTNADPTGQRGTTWE